MSGGAVWVYGGVVLVMSLVSAGLLWWDKRAARRDAWRVSERTLHGVELLGGWPGSWVVRRAIRHKTRKRQYRIVFALIVFLHVVLWVMAGSVVSGLWKF